MDKVFKWLLNIILIELIYYIILIRTNKLKRYKLKKIL